MEHRITDTGHSESRLALAGGVQWISAAGGRNEHVPQAVWELLLAAAKRANAGLEIKAQGDKSLSAISAKQLFFTPAVTVGMRIAAHPPRRSGRGR